MLPPIAFPVAILLILFGIFFLIYALYSFFTIYHLLRFGVYGTHLYFVVASYLLVSLVILIISFVALSRYDWTVPLSPSDLFNASQERMLDL